MKSIAWVAVAAMICSSAAFAQEQKPAAKPAPTEAAKPSVEASKPAAEAAKPAAQETAKPAETAKPKPVAQAKKAAGAKKAQRAERRTEDARHCLGRPSNIEIIKCAEAYL